ncbi:MAG: heparin lyase I family protein [Solirubrobacterales bacterium]
MPTSLETPKPAFLTVLLVGLLGLVSMVLLASSAAAAKSPALGAATPAKAKAGALHKKQKRHFRLGLGRSRALGGGVAVPSPPRKGAALLEAGFEENLLNWNTAGVGEVIPTVTTSIAREGLKSGRVVLTGNQNRSELILGGNGGGSTAGQVEFHEGDEYWYGFSFYINQMVYGKPGAHNLIMQFKSEGEGSPEFGLQLWDVHGERGLWTGGPSQEVNHGGERFLAPVAEQAWHDVQIHFRASAVGAGFYEVFLDGALVDARSGVSMIAPGRASAYIKDGLYRNGGTAPGTSELFLDAAKLGDSQAAVLPS